MVCIKIPRSETKERVKTKRSCLVFVYELSKAESEGQVKGVNLVCLPPVPDSYDDDVYYYIGERLKLKRETENMGV